MMDDLLRWAGLSDDPGTLHLDGRVLARSYPRRRHLPDLAARGVRLLINLHENPHPPAFLAEHGLHELHLPVPDFTPPTMEQLQMGVNAVEHAEGLTVVHCGAGLGRTGTLLACLYVAAGLNADSAIVRVRQERPRTIETADQEAAIRAFAERISEKSS